MVGGGTPGPCRAAGDLPLSPELFQSFGPILNRSRAAGAVEKKIQYIGIILISRAGETGRFIYLSQCPRTSGGRSQRSGECEISMPLHAVRLVFVVGLILRLPPLSAPFLSLRFPMKKKKCIVDRGIVETLTYPFIVVFLSFFCFVENVETPNNNRSGSKAIFHHSTNPQQQSINVSSPSP